MKKFLLLLALAAPLAAQSPAPQTPEAPGLRIVPTPDLASFEPAVAQQLREARELLDALLGQAGATPAELAEAYGELGRIYHAYGLSDAAAAGYANASALAPRDHRWPYYLAHVEQDRGRLAEAEAAYGRALELQPGYIPTLVHLGEVLLAADRPDEAENLLRRVVAADPGNAAARSVLGEVALSRRQYAEAAEHLQAALAAAPEADRLHHPLAMAFRGLGDLEKAREHLAKAGRVGVRPADPLMAELEQLRQGELAHLLRGRVAFRFGRYADAAKEFRKAVEARPESVPARINLGAALSLAGDRPGAVEQLREALKLAPDNGTAHYNLGILLAGEGKSDEAVRHLEEAVRLEPRDGAAQLELARALEKSGRPHAALIHYQGAAGLLPQNEQAWMEQANLLVSLERYREARDLLETASGNLPASGRILHGLARLLAASPEAALRDGKRALELALPVYDARGTATHAETVALALAESGRCDEAAEWQRNVIEMTRKEELSERLPALEGALARYQAGPPCRPPGAEGGGAG